MQAQGVVVWALLLAAACSEKGSASGDLDAGGHTGDAGDAGDENSPAGQSNVGGAGRSNVGGGEHGNVGGDGGRDKGGADHGGGEGGRANDAGDDAGGSAGDTLQGPAAQGAITFTVKTPSPLPPGKSCPSAAAFTSELPSGNGPTDSSYLAHVVDGEDGAVVSCRVAGNGTFELSGKIQLGGRGLLIEGGTVGADEYGAATITVSDSEHLPTSLRGSSCALSVKKGALTNLQIKAGAVWAAFSCPSVDAPPTDYCQASGIFVLENCAQE
jgi:hypothetical protein